MAYLSSAGTLSQPLQIFVLVTLLQSIETAHGDDKRLLQRRRAYLLAGILMKRRWLRLSLDDRPSLSDFTRARWRLSTVWHPVYPLWRDGSRQDDGAPDTACVRGSAP